MNSISCKLTIKIIVLTITLSNTSIAMEKDCFLEFFTPQPRTQILEKYTAESPLITNFSGNFNKLLPFSNNGSAISINNPNKNYILVNPMSSDTSIHIVADKLVIKASLIAPQITLSVNELLIHNFSQDRTLKRLNTENNEFISEEEWFKKVDNTPFEKYQVFEPQKDTPGILFGDDILITTSGNCVFVGNAIWGRKSVNIYAGGHIQAETPKIVEEYHSRTIDLSNQKIIKVNDKREQIERAADSTLLFSGGELTVTCLGDLIFRAIRTYTKSHN